MNRKEMREKNKAGVKVYSIRNGRKLWSVAQKKLLSSKFTKDINKKVTRHETIFFLLWLILC